MNILFRAVTIIIFASGFLSSHTSILNNSNEKHYEKFKVVFERLQKDYVKEPNKQQLIDYAIEGMLSSLDPHSSYFADEDLEYFVSNTKGELGGIGIEIVPEGNFIKVISPLDDLPSEKAGIKSGDLIVKVNEELVSNLGFNKALQEIRGQPGTKVKITIAREGSPKPIDFELTRELVKIKCIKTSIEDNIAYVRITSFTEKVTEELHKAFAHLQSQSKDGIKGIILDVRNNPGGLLDQAINVSDFFLDEGAIVSTRARKANTEIVYSAKPTTKKAPKVPMIVLINEGSASASEIAAAALRDNRRALLLGTKTYGKGSVQVLFPLDHRSACKFTTSLYYTPKGISIQAEGVHPDILVETAKVEYAKKDPKNISFSESALKNHIKNDQKQPSASHLKDAKDSEKNNMQGNKIESHVQKSDQKNNKSEKYLEDFQYARAFDLLQGIIILENKNERNK